MDIRRSEVPGYSEAYKKVEIFRLNVQSAFHNESKNPNDPSYENPATATNAYLFNLRESIATKSVEPK